jgi:hypothetical protein
MFSSPWVQGQLVELAQMGKLAGALIINDYGLANRLAQTGCRYVVHRNTDGENSYEPLDGTAGDVDRGRGMWEKLGRTQAANLDPRVYIMIGNESNAPRDGYYWLGQMQAATAEGRRLAIFANSVGHPNVHEVDGKWTSDTWQHRIDSGCMRFGKAHGHLANLHQYGKHDPIGKPLSDPGSAIYPDGSRDDAAYKWYGGRHVRVWRDILPDDCRMQIIVGECGPADAVYRGVDTFMSDFRGYQTRYGGDPYIAAYCYWTLSGHGALGWEFSSVDEALPAVLAWARQISV